MTTTTTTSREQAKSLYERLGGELAIMAAVERFYERVLADPLLKPFFTGLDMVSQSRKLVGFMARALGGPDTLMGRDLRSAHARLVEEKGLSDVHFDAVAAHLAASLDDLGVAQAEIDESLAIVGSVRDQVLNR